MCGVHRCLVDQLDWTSLSTNPVVALAARRHLLTVLHPVYLEMFCNDALKRILCDRDVK
jgi:hypothetical protein